MSHDDDDTDFQPLNYHEIHIWALQMHVMLTAGLPLVGALELIALGELPRLAAACDYLAERISQGRRLSESMHSLGPTFSPFAVNLVAVGEKSGRLAHVFERLSQRAFHRSRTQRSVRAALAYPAFLATVSIAMAFFMAFYMFPKLLPFLLGLRVPLPWPTRVLIWGTDHLAPALLVFSVLGLGLAHLLAFNDSPPIARLRDWLLYGSPLIGKVNRNRLYSDCLNDLHMLLEAQCDLLGSLRALQPPWAEQKEQILACVQLIRAGSTFTQAVETSGMLPRHFHAQVRSAEETGQLPKTFRMLSEQLEETVSMDLDRMTQLIEPLLMGGMGLVTGFIVVATFLPLYGMISTSL